MMIFKKVISERKYGPEITSTIDKLRDNFREYSNMLKDNVGMAIPEN